MLIMAPHTRVTGIVGELERVLVDRQALVHQLQSLAPERLGGFTSARATLSAQLVQLITRQRLLLDELAAIQPPAGRAE